MAASSESKVTSTIIVTVAWSPRRLVAPVSGWASAGAGETRRRRRVVVTSYMIETAAESTLTSERIASTATRSAVSLVALADATANTNVVW
jgi:uncharacterized protein YfaP (DUF2135 family)